MNYLNAMLLPEGYPHSVSDDYMLYQLWDTLQGFMSYLKAVLCTLAFLRGLGVGSEESEVSSAMLIWIFRDGTGMLAGLFAGMPIFTQKFGDLKKLRFWRMVAEFCRAMGGGCELLSSLCKEHFLHLVCLATCFNSFAGVISGVNRGALVLHFSKDGSNIADCAAKEGNQDRAVKLIGIALAVVFVRKASEDEVLACQYYIAITILHLYFNWLAVNALQLERDSSKSNTMAKSRPKKDE